MLAEGALQPNKILTMIYTQRLSTDESLGIQSLFQPIGRIARCTRRRYGAKNFTFISVAGHPRVVSNELGTTYRF